MWILLTADQVTGAPHQFLCRTRACEPGALPPPGRGAHHSGAAAAAAARHRDVPRREAGAGPDSHQSGHHAPGGQPRPGGLEAGTACMKAGSVNVITELDSDMWIESQ